MRFSARLLLFIVVSFGASAAQTWVGSWASSQMLCDGAAALEPDEFTHATLRQVVHLSAGGTAVRLHLSNVFGTKALHLMSVHLATPVSIATAQIQVGSDKALAFDGRPDVIIPPGAEYVSDPLQRQLAAEADLTISVVYEGAPEGQTGHPGSRATSYLVRGDLAAAPDLPGAKKFDRWYQIAGVDVLRDDDAFSIVALGDSITDGHGATTNGNDRWPDVLARRLQTAGMHAAGVLNGGIGGNHLLTDGIGPNALARLDRDVLSQTGVRYVLVLEGINDIGGFARTMAASPDEHASYVHRLIGAYRQTIERAHAHRLRVIGCTVTPFVGSGYYHPDEAGEADRQAINAWIRTPGHFDAVVDFDQVTRDPAHPDRLAAAFDSGDHLHPSPAGYAAMANAIPLSLFKAGFGTL